VALLRRTPLFLRLGSAVGATRRVQAVVGNQEALYRFAIDDVGLNDFVDVRGGHVAIPDRFGVHDNGGAVLTLVEASRHIGAHALFQSAQGQLLLELKLQLGLCLGIAAPARMARIALVAADEQMLLELGHEFNLQDFRGAKLSDSIGQIGVSSHGELNRIRWIG